jgi:hypothetical protein
MTQDCVNAAIGIDLYFTVAHTKSMDLASLSLLSSKTGGRLNYFPQFDVHKNGEKMHNILYRALTRQ